MRVGLMRVGLCGRVAVSLMRVGLCGYVAVSLMSVRLLWLRSRQSDAYVSGFVVTELSV